MFSGLSLDQAPPEDIPFRFFLMAPLFGIAWSILLIVRGEILFISNWNIETVAFTHLLTLGWLTSIMMGAIYQMIPVLVGGTVPFISFARVVHLLFGSGVVGFIGSLLFWSPTGLTIASLLIASSLLIFSTQAGIALFRVRADGRPTVFAMRIALISLFITASFGVIFIGF